MLLLLLLRLFNMQDEPTNHLDLDAIEWLEGYLKKQEVPMVVVSHDREFLDQLCTKIVETERGVVGSRAPQWSACACHAPPPSHALPAVVDRRPQSRSS